MTLSLIDNFTVHELLAIQAVYGAGSSHRGCHKQFSVSVASIIPATSTGKRKEQSAHGANKGGLSLYLLQGWWHLMMMLNCTALFGNVPMSLFSCKRPDCEVVHIVLAVIISYLQSIEHQKVNQHQTAQACGRDMLQQSMEQFFMALVGSLV